MSDEVVLRTRGLTKRFGKRRAVDGLDLEVRRGQVYGFLGPNGAGKTTTIRMLLGLVRPNSGDAKLLGVCIRRRRLEALRRVGAMVETPAFYGHLSAERNLALLASLSGGATGERIRYALDAVGLTGRERDRVRTYSHGMKQRLGIAQALLPHPELLVLDEPAGGLDPEGLREVRDLIRRLGEEEDLTIFLSSHLLHEVEHTCTHVGIIREGQLVASGSVAELLGSEKQTATLEVDDAGRASEVLAGQSFVAVAALGDGRLSVVAEPDRLAEVNALLVSEGVRVSALVPERTSLEEMYLRIASGEGSAEGEGGVQ
ncbi:MAG: ABC transporter ATP-binding protein [Armatimonadota bacterium]|jgi:ABC-2 type transport system ATP-binding protein